MRHDRRVYLENRRELGVVLMHSVTLTPSRRAKEQVKMIEPPPKTVIYLKLIYFFARRIAAIGSL